MGDKARADRRRVRIGLVIITASIGMLFWWGNYFEVFGKTIELNFRFLGFFFWIVLACFGMGYMQSMRAGLLLAAKFTLLLLVAGIFGFIGRHH